MTKRHDSEWARAALAELLHRIAAALLQQASIPLEAAERLRRR